MVRSIMRWHFLFISFLALASLAKAEDKKNPHNSSTCDAESRKFCGAITDRREFGSAGADFGKGLLGLMGSGQASLSYSGWYTPHVTPAGSQFHQGRLAYPVYKGETDTFSLTASGNTLLFDHPMNLASGGVLPTQFYKGDLNAHYIHNLNDGDFFGGGAQIGKASDKPFSDSPTYGANIFYSIKDGEHSRWLFSLQYSNNSPFLNGLPIPGIMYLYKTGDFIGLFGFPFASIQWKIPDHWLISASIIGTTAAAELAYGERKNLQGFLGFHSQRYSYMKYARTNPDDRVIYSERHVTTGLRFPLFALLQTELAGGYAFNRSVFESPKSGFRIDSSVIPTTIDNTWFAAWNFRIAF